MSSKSLAAITCGTCTLIIHVLYYLPIALIGTSSDANPSSPTSTKPTSSQADASTFHQSGPCTYIIGGDNIDFSISPRDMRSDN